MYKKILVITDNEPDQINGVVTTFKSIESYAINDGYSIVYLDPRQFYHCNCPSYPEVKLSFPWNIGNKIKKISPDHIHIATEGPLGLAARCWMDKWNWKYNTSYHTKFPEFLKKIYGIPEKFTYRYLKWFHKHSGKVLVTTDTMKKELKDHGFNSDMISWTRGVDRNKLKPSLVHEKRTDRKPIVLYVGRVSKEKNLGALCKLQDKYDIRIVGDGPHRKQLEKKYTQVKFLGYQTGEQLANSYVSADVFCFPSKSDTFGIVIIEALSLGTPVASYIVPGPIDIIEQGVNGFMCDDLEYSIEECLRLNREEVERSSIKWDWKYCWEIFKDNLIKI